MENDEIPVVYIKADTIEKAIETVQEYYSMSSAMTDEGISKFIKKADGIVDLEDITTYRIGDIGTSEIKQINIKNIQEILPIDDDTDEDEIATPPEEIYVNKGDIFEL